MDRRDLLKRAGGGAALALLGGCASPPRARRRPPNVLLLTADDLDHDSLGATGCPLPGVTPNLDRLAGEGLRFAHAHVAVAVCQPCRQALMTGKYPHRIGAPGFEPIRADVPTLQERLREAGYYQGILAKVGHLAPAAKFRWDVAVGAGELGLGREPGLYHLHAESFFRGAAGRPFFLMANAEDPHRPFPGSRQERRARERGRMFPAPPSESWRPDEVPLPPFLEDLPEVRQEVAHYFAAVHRADASVGAVLQALEESGLAGETLVMFLSDNGMAFPFAKTNCYRASTRTPWLVRWPGRVEAGRVEREQMIGGVDFAPTILEALNLAPLPDTDGRSFLPVLDGERQEGREGVFTAFYKTSAGKEFPMRAVQDRRYGYIVNLWADGKTEFKNESQAGLSFAAMQRAAAGDPRIAARVRHFLHRTPEELYDYERDPGARRNLIQDPEHAAVAERLRREMAVGPFRLRPPYSLGKARISGRK